MILEACVSTISGLKAAQKYGIQRIEICKDLHLEGLTQTEEFQSIANDILFLAIFIDHIIIDLIIQEMNLN